MKKILTLNNISPKGLLEFPLQDYEISSEFSDPTAILVRSANMHNMNFGKNLFAVGRAGTGVNNIPVERLSELGVGVFNAPGANANAVKELAIASMFMTARNLFAAADYVRNLQVADDALGPLVEDGKKQFSGFELPGHKLGVVGLGAIGVKVANAAVALGLEVYGYDPAISVKNAWHLSAQVKQAIAFEELLKHCDFLSFHVPLMNATRHMIRQENISRLKPSVVIMNFAREGVVDDDAILSALNAGRIRAYVTDFPTNANKNHPKVLALPHLGASTAEAEDNSAHQVVGHLRDFLEQGIVVNSVNLPEAVFPQREEGVSRLAIINDNESGMIARITEVIGSRGLNIQDMLNKSRGNIAYTLVDIGGQVPGELLEDLRQCHGIRSARLCL